MSKQYIDEFNDIFKINEVYNIMRNNRHYFVNYYYTFDESMINTLITLLPEKIIHYFKNFNKFKIKKLDDKEIYKLTQYGMSSADAYIKYFNNCHIMNKNMILIMKQIDKYFIEYEKYEEIKCLIGDKKVFMRLNIDNSFLINIGHLNNEFIFVSELLIHSFLFRNISLILETVKKKGFKYIKNYVTSNSIDNIYDNKNGLLGTVYKTGTDSELDFSNINDKLLTLIKISIYHIILLERQNQIKTKTNIKFNNNVEEVFLLNNKYLEQYGYIKIFNMICNNNEILKIILNNNYNINDKSKFNNIINNLQMNKLTELNENINQITEPDNNIPLIPKGTDMKLSYKRNIKIYKEFILINKDLLNTFEEKFYVKYQTAVKFKFIMNKKSLLITNYEDQHIILIGNFSNDNINLFNINYILDYKTNNILINEIDKILLEEYNLYINKYLIYNENIENDNISPIFDINNNIIGFGYKYNEKFEYNYYSKYYYNIELINVLRLYIFYKQINNSLNSNSGTVRQKFYLINADYLKRYKSNYEYENIYNELNMNNNIQYIIKNNIQNNFDSVNMRIIFSILKNMERSSIKEFNEIIEDLKKQYTSYVNFEPEKKNINYVDNERKHQVFSTYHNFEILSSNVGRMFNEMNKILSDGIINNGKILINLPYNLNNKNIWIVGNINNENIFNAEYYFIYNKKNYADKHINYIFKYMGLDHYLNKLKIINDTQFIINDNDNFKIIGTIIKCETNNNPIHKN